MPKSGYTHITFILDRSGSMESIRDDVIGGFNRFIDDQKTVPGECTLTLVQFDSQNPYEILRDHMAIGDVKRLGSDYFPRAGTPLYDAMGRGIVNTGEKLNSLPEDQRPDKVLFVTLTDGLENESHEYSRARVFEMVKRQTDVYKWEFVYLGANQDAMAVGGTVGVVFANAATFAASSAGVGAAMHSLSANARSYRTGATGSMGYTDKQRQEQVQ